ncbi:MAG: hypothetical protein V3V28_02675 [Polaribacter sp.]|uniref:NADase-type glycan-binding domain-containing protein n=1 Tax=Polaribacter sp. TaxID=1920175 RepID=UPI002F352AC1
MKKLIYIAILSLVFTACNSNKKLAIKSNILNLKESFIAKDETQFLIQFPKNFKQFSSYFGWDSENDKPEVLYFQANTYIDYWFNLVANKKYKAYETTITSICIDGKWEADAVSYFQDKTINYIKENQQYNLINALDDTKAKSVLFFLFDGPHPKSDTDFTAHLSISKKEILNDLFKNTFVDADKNISKPNIESIDLIDVKETDYKLATIDSISIKEIKSWIEDKLPTIFDYYQYEKIDDVEIWSDKLFGRCCTEADLMYSELLYFDITAKPNNNNYPYANLSDRTYRTAYAFKENENIEIYLKLDRDDDIHKYHTELLIDDVLKSTDTLLKPFRLSLVNGYVKSEKNFNENGRVKGLKVFLNKDYKETIKLLDTPLVQEFALDFTFSKNDTVKLIPISYYKGTIYDDICISEIQSSLAHITHSSINKKYKVSKLWEIGYALNKNKE